MKKRSFWYRGHKVMGSALYNGVRYTYRYVFNGFEVYFMTKEEAKSYIDNM